MFIYRDKQGTLGWLGYLTRLLSGHPSDSTILSRVVNTLELTCKSCTNKPYCFSTTDLCSILPNYHTHCFRSAISTCPPRLERINC